METINRLQKLPINRGLYLVLPNIDSPLFIVPLTSKWAYKTAISLIKPRNFLGAVKKRLLSEIPFFILKRFFSTISIDTNRYDQRSGQLILPWNQDTGNKFTLFNFDKEKTTLLKIGYGKAQNLIDNEHTCISLLSKLATGVIPEIRSYLKFEDHSILETEFYKGQYPASIPENVNLFFQNLYRDAEKVPFKEHPYISRISNVVLSHLSNADKRTIIDAIVRLNTQYNDNMVPVVIMHGDCSMTNMITCNGNGRIIDWEEGIIDGAPLDLAYFYFRKTIDNGGGWEIHGLDDFLVVLHYLYFQIKHGNSAFLDKVEWNGRTVLIR